MKKEEDFRRMEEIREIMDSDRITRTLFYPRKFQKPRENDKLKVLECPMEDGAIIGGLFFVEDKSLPTILLFHGNGEVSQDYEPMAPIFHRMGYNLAIMDYRGYGFSSGNPSFSNIFNDTPNVYQCFLNYLSEHGFNKKIVLFGRSLGSIPAAILGSTAGPEVAGIIFESGICRLYELVRVFFPHLKRTIKPEDLESWSNHTFIRKIKKPTLIIHGTHDMIVFAEHGECIYNELPEDVDKKLVLIEGAGHNNIMMFEDEYFGAISEFLQKIRKKG